MYKYSAQSGPRCGVTCHPVLNSYYFKLPVEPPWRSVEESMGKSGSACSVGLK